MMQKESLIVPCAECGAKNRVPPHTVGTAAKCGKCGSSLETDQGKVKGADFRLLRCTECGAKNRIPLKKINAGAKCGRCGVSLKTDELFEPQPLMVTDGNFESKVLESPLPVLLFAWAPWCPTCRAAMPVIDDFGKESKGKVRVGKLNVDSNPLLSSRYNILSVPTLFIFDGGQLKQTLPGALQKNEIMMKMAPYI